MFLICSSVLEFCLFVYGPESYYSRLSVNVASLQGQSQHLCSDNLAASPLCWIQNGWYLTVSCIITLIASCLAQKKLTFHLPEAASNAHPPHALRVSPAVPLSPADRIMCREECICWQQQNNDGVIAEGRRWGMQICHSAKSCWCEGDDNLHSLGIMSRKTRGNDGCSGIKKFSSIPQKTPTMGDYSKVALWLPV